MTNLNVLDVAIEQALQEIRQLYLLDDFLSPYGNDYDYKSVSSQSLPLRGDTLTFRQTACRLRMSCKRELLLCGGKGTRSPPANRYFV